jgi:hypothetical protein
MYLSLFFLLKKHIKELQINTRFIVKQLLNQYCTSAVFSSSQMQVNTDLIRRGYVQNTYIFRKKESSAILDSFYIYNLYNYLCIYIYILEGIQNVYIIEWWHIRHDQQAQKWCFYIEFGSCGNSHFAATSLRRFLTSWMPF